VGIYANFRRVTKVYSHDSGMSSARGNWQSLSVNMICYETLLLFSPSSLRCDGRTSV
jgi:hypothetical protein